MWFRRKKAAPPQSSTPAQDRAALPPVIEQNHVGYFPINSWAGVPGAGTGNLVYAPDFAISAPYTVWGNTTPRKPNSVMIAQRPAEVLYPVAVMQGIGGVTAGQIALQSLLEVQAIDNNALDNTGSY